MGDVIANIFEQILSETKNSGASHAARMLTIDKLAKRGLEAREAETRGVVPKPGGQLCAAAEAKPVAATAPVPAQAAAQPVAKPNVPPKA